MALRTAEEYKNSLIDDRVIWYRGARVDNICEHPELSVAVNHAAIDFELAADPTIADLTTADDGDGPYSAYWKIPRGPEDLARRSQLIEHATAAGGTLVLLVKEIGSDALFALLRTLHGEDRERALTLANALVGCGWSVWWDRKIIAGQTFDQVIERELETARSVVVLWSKDSISSEWVKNEAAVAFWIGMPAISMRSVVLKKVVSLGHQEIVCPICRASNCT